MRWLNEIQRKLSEVRAKYLILDGEVKPGERVLGTLPEDLLRLWGLQRQMMDDVREIGKEHTMAHLQGRTNGHSCQEFMEQGAWLLQQREAVRELFWTCVRAEFNIPLANLGVREHGQVVTYGGPQYEEVDEATAEQLLRMANCTGAPN